jgi:photosystem II stability/assembly factor-like uncharacterized protein
MRTSEQTCKMGLRRFACVCVLTSVGCVLPMACLSRTWEECAGPQETIFCPEGRVCAGGRCVTQRQVDVCADKKEGEACANSSTLTDLNDVAFAGDADSAVVVGGAGVLLTFDGSTWKLSQAPLPIQFNSIWLDENGNGLMGGDAGAIAFLRDGTWQAERVFEGNIEATWAVPQTVGPPEYWLAGDSGLLARAKDGKTFTRLDGIREEGFTDLYGVEHVIFAVTDGGTLYRIDTKTDQRDEFIVGDLVSALPSKEFNGVYASSADDFFLVGKQSTIVRFSGGKWELNTAPIPDNIEFNDISGTADGSLVFAVGNQGTVARFDGVKWTRDESNVGVDLNGISLFADTAFATGSGGVILELDEGKWVNVSNDGTCQVGACVAKP